MSKVFSKVAEFAGASAFATQSVYRAGASSSTTYSRKSVVDALNDATQSIKFLQSSTSTGVPVQKNLRIGAVDSYAESYYKAVLKSFQ